jgi:rare lipoprotein A
MRSWRSLLLIVSLIAGAGLSYRCPALAQATAPGALTGAVGETQTGLAAVYSHRLSGHRTASGQRYNPKALTAAHQTLPFGTKVKVTNVKNGKSVVLRINDRGPTQPNRILDVSAAAAHALGFGKHGLVEVKLEVVGAHPSGITHVSHTGKAKKKHQ